MTKVSEVMTRDVVSVTPETPIKQVAEALVGRAISGVPVCAGDGRVVGRGRPVRPGAKG
jgi:CBS domain-containing protein